MDFTNLPRRNKTYTGAGNDAWNLYNKREGKAFRKKREDIGYIFKAAEKRLTYTEKEARFPGFFFCACFQRLSDLISTRSLSLRQ